MLSEWIYLGWALGNGVAAGFARKTSIKRIPEGRLAGERDIRSHKMHPTRCNYDKLLIAHDEILYKIM